MRNPVKMPDNVEVSKLTPRRRPGKLAMSIRSPGHHPRLRNAVDIQPREISHTRGRFGWTGGFGITAYTDPAEETIGILFTQRMMDSPEPPKVFTDFWTLAYEAVE
jgi:CubicO group peptidase (beta-lactamase class C family)